MRELLERGRDGGEAVRQVLRQADQVERNLSGLLGADDAAAVDGRRGQGGGGEDRLPVPLLSLARSRSSHSSQASVGDGPAHPGLPSV